MLTGVDVQLIAHLIRFDQSKRYKLNVEVHPDVLSFDFRVNSTRRDIPDRNYVPRPGFFVSKKLRFLKDNQRCALVANGNNVGYWGNQFAVIKHNWVFKTTSPIFCDANEDVSEPYRFLLQDPDGTFHVEDVYVSTAAPVDEKSMAGFEFKRSSSSRAPAVGVSGFPLICSGTSVWRSYLHHAWDPRLIYEVGPIVNASRAQILCRLVDAEFKGLPLLRHAVTVIGLDAEQHLILVVVEASPRSQGASIDEITYLLLQLGVEDAIVTGAAGDSQLASTDEGLIVWPLVSAHDKEASRLVEESEIATMVPSGVKERPVPGVLIIETAV